MCANIGNGGTYTRTNETSPQGGAAEERRLQKHVMRLGCTKTVRF